jgi:hypothetical protein
MWSWAGRYHASLIRRGNASDDGARYGEIQSIALPWLLALGAMVICSVVAELLPVGPMAWQVQLGIVLLVGVPATLGMIYAMGVYLFAAIRADRRKRRITP